MVRTLFCAHPKSLPRYVGWLVGKYRDDDVAEGVFGAFLAFMMVMAISTIFLFGRTTTTTLSSISGGIGLCGLIWHVRPKEKHK